MTNPDDSFHAHTNATTHGGISLREWYAGMALQGLARMSDLPEIADAAVALADELIKRLNRPVKRRDPDPGEDLIDLAGIDGGD